MNYGKSKQISIIEAINDIMGCGPICAIDEDRGLVVTVNGAYLNLYAVGEGVSAIDCRARDKDLYNTTGAQMIDEAKQWLADLELASRIDGEDLDDYATLAELAEDDDIKAYIIGEGLKTEREIERAEVQKVLDDEGGETEYRGVKVRFVMGTESEHDYEIVPSFPDAEPIPYNFIEDMFKAIDASADQATKTE